MTGELLFKAHAHDIHRLLSYHNNDFAIRLSHYRYYCTSLKGSTIMQALLILRFVKRHISG